jgi:hypothetical protein
LSSADIILSQFENELGTATPRSIRRCVNEGPFPAELVEPLRPPVVRMGSSVPDFWYIVASLLGFCIESALEEELLSLLIFVFIINMDMK